jgi:hypothetical protein
MREGREPLLHMRAPPLLAALWSAMVVVCRRSSMAAQPLVLLWVPPASRQRIHRPAAVMVKALPAAATEATMARQVLLTRRLRLSIPRHRLRIALHLRCILQHHRNIRRRLLRTVQPRPLTAPRPQRTARPRPLTAPRRRRIAQHLRHTVRRRRPTAQPRRSTRQRPRPTAQRHLPTAQLRQTIHLPALPIARHLRPTVRRRLSIRQRRLRTLRLRRPTVLPRRNTVPRRQRIAQQVRHILPRALRTARVLERKTSTV